jgi:type IV pilus assembly protein PilB
MKYDKKIDKPLGQILMERGVINNAQLQEAVDAQKREGGLIGEVIVGLGFAKEEDIAYCLSLQFGYPYLPLYNYEISGEVTGVIPKNVCLHYCLVPIDKIGNTLTIAMSNPLNTQAIEDLEEIIHCDIQIFVSTPSDIRKSVEHFYK